MSASTTPPDGVRPDLAWVEVDDEIVVYDPVASMSHLLAGGAAIVWRDLARSGRAGAIERVTQAVQGASADDVRAVIEDLEALGFLSAETVDGS
jgi:hypothetical protein